MTFTAYRRFRAPPCRRAAPSPACPAPAPESSSTLGGPVRGKSAIVCGGASLQDGQFLPQLVQAVLVDVGEFLNGLP